MIQAYVDNSFFYQVISAAGMHLTQYLKTMTTFTKWFQQQARSLHLTQYLETNVTFPKWFQQQAYSL